MDDIAKLKEENKVLKSMIFNLYSLSMPKGKDDGEYETQYIVLLNFISGKLSDDKLIYGAVKRMVNEQR